MYSQRIYPKIEESEFQKLFDLLSTISIPKKSGRANRRGFSDGHRSTTFGMSKGRFNGIIGLSSPSKKYPEVYKEILRLGKICCPFEFNSIHLNHNVVCPPHKDSKNAGVSCLISFGNYTGCNIVIDNVNYDAKHTPIVFDGSKIEHWNTDDLQGNKYSLVFFNTAWSNIRPSHTHQLPQSPSGPSYRPDPSFYPRE